MNRSLRLILLVVLVAGAVRLSVYAVGRARAAREEARPVSVPRPWTNPPAPPKPPATPPPGRPYAAPPVDLRGPAPTRAQLQEAMRGASVLIIVLDAARADHFGCYGYPRATTPNVDRLAREAVRFDQHFCNLPSTRPSTVALFTSHYPDSNGVTGNITGNPGIRESTVRGMAQGAFTIESALGQAGFGTFLFSSNPLASPKMGVGGDFQKAYFRVGSEGSRGGAVAFLQSQLARYAPWAGRRAAGRTYVYLHVLPPHSPYAAPEEFERPFSGSRPPAYFQGDLRAATVMQGRPAGVSQSSWVTWGNEYDANLRWADSVVGEVVEGLRKAGQLERTLLIITADHGEALKEHGYSYHGDVPYDEAQHIPLLVRFPGSNKPIGRIGALTQTIDIGPTILELCGLSVPRGAVQGKSLVPLLTGEAARVNDYLFCRAPSDTNSFYTIRDSHATLLLFHGGEPQLLFDMDTDPWQLHDVRAARPQQAEAMVRAFEAFVRQQTYPPRDFLDPSYRPPRVPDGPAVTVTEDTRRALKSLGYVK